MESYLWECLEAQAEVTFFRGRNIFAFAYQSQMIFNQIITFWLVLTGKCPVNLLRAVD